MAYDLTRLLMCLLAPVHGVFGLHDERVDVRLAAGERARGETQGHRTMDMVLNCQFLSLSMSVTLNKLQLNSSQNPSEPNDVEFEGQKGSPSPRKIHKIHGQTLLCRKAYAWSAAATWRIKGHMSTWFPHG